MYRGRWRPLRVAVPVVGVETTHEATDAPAVVDARGQDGSQPVLRDFTPGPTTVADSGMSIAWPAAVETDWRPR